jgi:hypothetical protein
MEKKDKVKKEVQPGLRIQPEMYVDILHTAASIRFPHNVLPRSSQPECCEMMLKRTRETTANENKCERIYMRARECGTLERLLHKP